ncbi:3'-phosphoadenosine 5'-phosphosulfate sulfotransferase [Cryptotrichosporon argae]
MTNNTQSAPVLPIAAADLQRVLSRGKDDDALGQRIGAALALIEGVLDDIGEDALAISFNGGKDCTVLLHLYAAVLYARRARVSPSLEPAHAAVTLSTIQPDPSLPPSSPFPAPPSAASTSAAAHTPPRAHSLPSSPATSSHIAPAAAPLYAPIKAIYITAPNPFDVLNAFVEAAARRYALDLYTFGGGMKGALMSYLRCGGGRGVKAVLVGTRRGDPNGNVPALAPTDPSWPPFLRVHPILDWSYADIWAFLRALAVPYCALYDAGYTSLGSTTNTDRNPLLRDESAPGGWLPAWRLQDEAQERAGRR